MSLQDYNIGDILQCAIEWTRGDDGNYVVKTGQFDGGYPTYKTLTIPRSRLCDVHPDLSTAMDALNDITKSTGSQTIKSQLVTNTLKLLRGEHIEFRSVNDKLTLMLPRDLSDSVMADQSHVCIYGKTLYCKEIHVGSKIIRVATAYAMFEYEVPKSELNQRYPGWQNRWAAAAELGLSDKELATFVFSNTVELTENLDLKDITFPS